MNYLKFNRYEKTVLSQLSVHCPICGNLMKKVGQTTNFKEHLYKCPNCGTINFQKFHS